MSNRKIHAGGRVYTAEEFVCEWCGTPLVLDTYYTIDGKNVCQSCRNKERCAVCGFLITESKYVTVDDKLYHPDCFRCSECLIELQKFHLVDGKLMCGECLTLQAAERDPDSCCAKCFLPLSGDVIRALGNRYHEDCFICHSCFKPFPNDEFVNIKGNPYCDNCVDNESYLQSTAHLKATGNPAGGSAGNSQSGQSGGYSQGGAGGYGQGGQGSGGYGQGGPGSSGYSGDRSVSGGQSGGYSQGGPGSAGGYGQGGPGSSGGYGQGGPSSAGGYGQGGPGSSGGYGQGGPGSSGGYGQGGPGSSGGYGQGGPGSSGGYGQGGPGSSGGYGQGGPGSSGGYSSDRGLSGGPSGAGGYGQGGPGSSGGVGGSNVQSRSAPSEPDDEEAYIVKNKYLDPSGLPPKGPSKYDQKVKRKYGGGIPEEKKKRDYKSKAAIGFSEETDHLKDLESLGYKTIRKK